jgi:hypothetical protein
MGKRRYYTNVDRYMTEYKMRTPYATPTKINRLISNQPSARSIQQHSAHERSHLKHNSPDAFYHSEGRIDKNSRTKKDHQEHTQIETNNYHHETVSTTPQKSSCCTIL